MGDLVRPLKEGMRDYAHNIGVACVYDAAEDRAWHAICQRFDLDPILPDSVKHADLVALATEKRDLMPAHPEPWLCLVGIQPHFVYIDPWPPGYAALNYHQRLMQLLSTTHRSRTA